MRKLMGGNEINRVSPGILSRARELPAVIWISLLTAVCLVPFANKAFFIDDTLFLRVAEQIHKHPTDFFGFAMNWDQSERPMMHNIWNPPMAGYYAALAAAVGGWSEWTLHLAFIVPAVIAAAGICSLARFYCGRAALAAVIAVVSPVFLISSTTIMCDIMLVAFWVWAVVWFEAGLSAPDSELRNSKIRNPSEGPNAKSEPARKDETISDSGRRPSSGPRISAFGFPPQVFFLLSGVLAGLGYLAKFTALALVPLLIAYGLFRRRRLGWWLLAPALPLVVAAGYEWLTYHLYGQGHFLLSSGYNHRAQVHRGLGDELTTGLVFAGGCCLPVLFYAPFLWSRRVLATGLLLVWLGCLALPHLPRFAPFLAPKGAMNWGLSLQAAVLAVNGLQILALAGIDFWQRRQPGSLLLLLWVVGIFVYAIVVNYTINGRGLLLLAPALGILVARRLEERAVLKPLSGGLSLLLAPNAPRSTALLLLPALPGLLLSLLLVKADCNVAAAERAAATDLCAKYQQPGRTIWFEGHWGFQWYMEKLGARAVDMLRPQIRPQDVLVIPNSTPGAARPDMNAVEFIDAVKYLPNTYYSTLNPSIGAGFYSDYRGPLPFAFGRLKPDYYLVFKPKP